MDDTFGLIRPAIQMPLLSRHSVAKANDLTQEMGEQLMQRMGA